MIPLVFCAAAPGTTLPSVFAYWLGGAGNAVASVLLLTGCHLQVHRETTINAPIMYCGNPDDETTCRQEIPPQAP